MTDLVVSHPENHVAQVEIVRPPHNYFDVALVADLATTLIALADDGRTRAVVLCSAGRNFCAGADFRGGVATVHPDTGRHLYDHAVDLLAQPLPVVAAVQGAAIGGGLGLAMIADERVVSAGSRLTANFTRLGFHPGFGLTATLPWFVGRRTATELLVTGRDVGADEAVALGLADETAPDDDLRAAALRRAGRYAGAAPLAVRSVRETMRSGLADAVRAGLEREAAEQHRLMRTADWAEGVAAARDRRDPAFVGA